MGSRDEAMTAPLVQTAKQGVEARDWSWVEGSVWTDRMLSAPVTVSKEAFGIVCRPNKFFATPRAVHPGRGLAESETVPMRKPSTGEPYAGKPPVRFGGRGGVKAFPTPISAPLPPPCRIGLW